MMREKCLKLLLESKNSQHQTTILQRASDNSTRTCFSCGASSPAQRRRVRRWRRDDGWGRFVTSRGRDRGRRGPAGRRRRSFVAAGERRSRLILSRKFSPAEWRAVWRSTGNLLKIYFNILYWKYILFIVFKCCTAIIINLYLNVHVVYNLYLKLLQIIVLKVF